MTLSIITRVQNTDEVRQDRLEVITADSFMDVLSEELADAVSQHSGQATNWYDNDIETIITIGNIKVTAVVAYSFSSQYLHTTIEIDGKEIANEEWENNQMDHDFDWEQTPMSFIWDNEDQLMAVA